MVTGYKIGNLAIDSIASFYRIIIPTILASHDSPSRVAILNGATYQVTAGKTFKCCGVRALGWTEGTAVDWGLRYADNAALTTNPVAIPCNVVNVVAGTFDYPAFFDVPAGKYFGMYGASGFLTESIFCWGYEI